MANEPIGQAVLSISTDPGAGVQGIEALKTELKSVASTAADASSAASANWESMAKAIVAVSDKLSEQKAAARETGDGYRDVGSEIIDVARDIGGAFGVAFSIDAAVEWLSSLDEAAAHLQTLSLETQMSAQDLQLLRNATESYGVDADTLARALFQLQQRIAGGDDSVATAYHLMGISLDEVKSKNPLDLFILTERGLGSLQGAIRDTAAADLFGGRLGGSLLAFSTHVDEAIAKQRALNNVVSNEGIKSLADYNEQIDQTKQAINSWATTNMDGAVVGLAQTRDALTTGSGAWSVFKGMVFDAVGQMFGAADTGQHLAAALDGVTASANASAGATHAAAASNQQLAGAEDAATAAAKRQSDGIAFVAKTLQDGAKPLEAWQEMALQALETANQLTAKNAAAIGVTPDQLAAFKQGQEEAKQFAAAMTELDSAGDGWRGTLETISGDTVEAVKYYLDAGVAQDKLATAYGLTVTQIAAVKSALDDETKAEKLAQATADQTATVWTRVTDIKASLLHDQLAQAQATADKDYQIALDAAHKKGIVDAAYYNALETLRQQSVAAEKQRLAEESSLTREHYQGIADAATAAYEDALAGVGQYTTKGLERLHATMVQAQADLQNWAEIADASITSTGGKMLWLDGTLSTFEDDLNKLSAGNSIDYDLTTAQGVAQFHKLNPSAYVGLGDDQLMAMAKSGVTLQQMIQEGVIDLYAGIKNSMSHFSTGVRNFGGGVAIVGEEGPEKIYLPPGSDVVPHSAIVGGVPGGGMTVHLHFEGAVLSDPEKLQRAIIEALETALRRNGSILGI